MCSRPQETRSQISNKPTLAIHTAIRQVWECGCIIYDGDSRSHYPANACVDADTERQGSRLHNLQGGRKGTDVRWPQRFVSLFAVAVNIGTDMIRLRPIDTCRDLNRRGIS